MAYYHFKNFFELEKYDDFGNCIESYSYFDTCTINMQKAVEVAKKRESYIERGYQVLEKENYKDWENLVRSSIYGKSSWMNAGIIASALMVMKDLSDGKKIEEAYKYIDIQNEKPIYNNLMLSEDSASKASEIVISLHQRGNEFSSYYNQMLKEIIDKGAKQKN